MEPTRPTSLRTTTVNNNPEVHYDSVVLIEHCPEAERKAQIYLALKHQLPKSTFIPPTKRSKKSSKRSKKSSIVSKSPSTGLKTPSTRSKSSSTVSMSPSISHNYENSIDSTFTVIEELLGPLPQGWEQARTPEGQIYFLNHLTKTSHWEDPRWSLVAGATYQHSTEHLLIPGNDSGSGMNKNVTPGPSPDRWEQAYTADGDAYFINHLTKTTSWFDPSVNHHLQSAPTSGAAEHPSDSESWLENDTSDLMWSTQVPQQELKIHSLQMQLQLQEIPHQQELMLCSYQPTDQWCNTSDDLHDRQEFADSGLGLGNNHSLPHIPEGFLSSNTDNPMDKNMDDNMDCTPDTSNEFAGNGQVGRQDHLVPSLQVYVDYDILNKV